MKSKLNFDTKNAFPLQFGYLVDVTVFIIIYPPAIDAHCLIIHGQVSKLNIQKQFCRYKETEKGCNNISAICQMHSYMRSIVYLIYVNITCSLKNIKYYIVTTMW